MRSCVIIHHSLSIFWVISCLLFISWQHLDHRNDTLGDNSVLMPAQFLSLLHSAEWKGTLDLTSVPSPACYDALPLLQSVSTLFCGSVTWKAEARCHFPVTGNESNSSCPDSAGSASFTKSKRLAGLLGMSYQEGPPFLLSRCGPDSTNQDSVAECVGTCLQFQHSRG